MMSVEGVNRNFGEQMFLWRVNGVQTPLDVDLFRQWAVDQNFSYQDLLLLSDVNIQAIEILAGQFSGRWEHSDPNSVAVIIPATNELEISVLLGDIQRQAVLRPERFHVYVAINGEGTDQESSLTFRAVQKADISPADNVTIEPVLIDGKGKALAQLKILEQLTQSSDKPGKLIFLDGDVRLLEAETTAIDEMLRALDEGASASSVRVTRPETESPHELARQIHGALTDVQNGAEGMGSLQGGGYALNAGTAALYEAYATLLPGLHAVDINWSALLRLLQIPVFVSDKTLMQLKTDDKTLEQLTRQHARWIMGMLEEKLFLPDKSRGHRTRKDVKRDLSRLFYTSFMKNISISPKLQLYVRAHIAAALLGNAPLTFQWGNNAASFGGKFQNPYIPAGWSNHR